MVKPLRKARFSSTMERRIRGSGCPTAFQARASDYSHDQREPVDPRREGPSSVGLTRQRARPRLAHPRWDHSLSRKFRDANHRSRPFDDRRGHFISLLFRCRVRSPLERESDVAKPDGFAPLHGDLAWVCDAPALLHPAFEVDRNWLSSTKEA